MTYSFNTSLNVYLTISCLDQQNCKVDFCILQNKRLFKTFSRQNSKIIENIKYIIVKDRRFAKYMFQNRFLYVRPFFSLSLYLTLNLFIFCIFIIFLKFIQNLHQTRLEGELPGEYGMYHTCS